ncbi:MAG: cytidylate kinase family protein [Ignavibacteriota bacterium]
MRSAILQDREEAFHVFVYAPWKDRVERVRARDEFSGPIDAYIAAVDRRRATYVRRYYGCDWKDPHLYDLMVSSK